MAVMPNYLILDIEEETNVFTEYLERGFGDTYLNPVEVVDMILLHVCNDEPLEGLEDLLSKVFEDCEEEGLAVNDAIELVEYIRRFGEVLIKAFNNLGFDRLEAYWGYQVMQWNRFNTIILEKYLDYDISRGLKLSFYEMN